MFTEECLAVVSRAAMQHVVMLTKFGVKSTWNVWERFIKNGKTASKIGSHTQQGSQL